MCPPGNPDSNSSRLWISLLLWWLLPFTAVILFLLPLVSPLVVHPKWDEFIYAFDSQRLLMGQIPYLDFFNFTPPGIFYFLAGVALPFGRVTLTLARYTSMGVILVNWTFLRIALKQAGWTKSDSLLLSLVYPICVYPFWPVISHHWLVHAACFGFLVVITSARLETAPFKRAVLMGLCAGIGGVVLQTEGLYLTLGCLTLLLLENQNRDILKTVLGFLTGIATPLVTAYLPLLLAGAGSSMIHDLIIWPAANYSARGNDNARPILDDLSIRLQAIWSSVHLNGYTWRTLLIDISGTALYILLLLIVLAVLIGVCFELIKTIRSRTFESPKAGMAILVTFLILGIFPVGRPDWLRFLFFFIFIVALWLIVWVDKGLAVKRRRIIVVIALCVLIAGSIYQSRWILYRLPHCWELTDVDRPARESPVNRWLHLPGVIRPGDSVAALFEGGEVYLYGTPPAIGYTYFTPLSEKYNNLNDHEQVASEMIKNKPRWVLMPISLESDYLDKASPVGRLIRQKYIRRGRIGSEAIYELIPRRSSQIKAQQ